MAMSVDNRVRQLIGDLVVQSQAAAARIEELEEKVKELLEEKIKLLESAQQSKANGGGDIKLEKRGAHAL